MPTAAACKLPEGGSKTLRRSLPSHPEMLMLEFVETSRQHCGAGH